MLRSNAMTTVAGNVDIDAVSGGEHRRGRVDASLDRVAADKVRLVVSVVLDD
jgi:hypothetical protein